MVGRSLEIMRASNVFDFIVVSSDDDDILNISRQNGAAYYFDIENFLLKKNRFLDQVLPYIMPKSRSIDIDEQFDLDLVRMIIRNKT